MRTISPETPGYQMMTMSVDEGQQAGGW